MERFEGQERRQRVRIGLTGLAFVFLLVLLGTAISRSGDDMSNSLGNADNLIAADPDDPLAQIGAAPGIARSDNDVAVEDADKAKPTAR